MHKSSFLIILGKLTFFLVFSFVLIHLLSFLGLFLAIAYSILWLAYPKGLPCLFCRVQKEGKRCPFCRQSVSKAAGISPKSFLSAIYNGATILAISLVCFLVVLGEYKLLFQQIILVPRTASFVIPSKASYRLEEIFPMKMGIANLKVPINAVQADIGFDSQRLELVDISTEGSFATIFIQKEINNRIGYARLSGGLPNPGFSDKSGIFGTIYFKGKSPGLARVEFLPSSLVLANNGRGSNVLSEFGAVHYLILPERISEQEKKQQKAMVTPNVLGEETEATQLKFYDEKKVLADGAALPADMPVKRKLNLGQAFLLFLEQIDRFILNFWGVNLVNR
ncbi:MAG TPA: cohesin domain-containing protein [Patescibacteria group bacterium]|nr:cohesin domain-containing protein [Patescibacteria group bacterium]